MGICRRMHSVGFLNGLEVVMFAILLNVDLGKYARGSKGRRGGRLGHRAYHYVVPIRLF